MATNLDVERRNNRRRLALALAAVLVIGTIVSLAITADARERGVQQFFGLWRLRHILMAAAGLWLSAGILAATISRAAVFRWLAISISLAGTMVLIEAIGLAGLIDFSRVLKSRNVNAYGAERLANVDVRRTTFQDIWTRWGIDSQPISFHFKTDHRGFRNAQDRGAADIYLLGDSMLVAGLVPFEKTVTDRLESESGRSIMSISLIGLSVQDERDLLIEVNPPPEERLVIHFAFEGNDPLDSRTYRKRKAPRTNVPAETDWKSRSPTYNVLMMLQEWSQPTDPMAARRTGYIGEAAYGFM